MSAIRRKSFSKYCRPYQDDGVSFMYEHDEALLLLRMGGGKTVITLSAIAELLSAKIIGSVLIVAPLAVCNNVWRKEPDVWRHTHRLDIGIATGTARERKAVMDRGHTITVINYENLQWLAHHYPNRPFDLIVLDEITKMNNPAGKRYKALRPYLKRADMRWGLTGSLAANSLEHVYNPVRCIDLGATLGETIGPFRRDYFRKATFGFDMLPGSPEKVAAKIAHLCYQPDPAVYQSQLPEILVTRHTYELGDEAQAKYAELTADFVTEHQGQTIDVASAGVLVNKLQQTVSGFLYTEEGKTVRIDEDRLGLLAELIAEAAGENIIIWYWFETSGNMLRDLGYLDLIDNLDSWNRGEIPVAICHPRSGSHGINAQAGGSRMVFFEHVWSAEERAQAVARLHRQGQENTVMVHDLVAEINGGPAIDAAILQAQADKTGVANAVLQTLL